MLYLICDCNFMRKDMQKQFEKYLNNIKQNYHVADYDLLQDNPLSNESKIYHHITSIENKDSILENGFLLDKANTIKAIYFSKGMVTPTYNEKQQQIVFLTDLSNISSRSIEGGDIAIEEDISPETIFGWIILGKIVEDEDGLKTVVYDKNHG